MNLKFIQFGVLLLSNVLGATWYEMSTCPTAILWNRRAAEKCESKWHYHCLYDALNSNATYNIHQEKCITVPKRYKGKRFILSGNLNAIDCPSDRYTPEPTWSNTLSGSECPLKKSSCDEEGQITVDNGTSKKDRSCRCNYKLGYNYVIKPSDPCKCYPLQEDCSCYIHHCSRKLEILSPDYGCVEKPFLTIGNFVCSELTDKLDNSDTNNISAKTESGSFEGHSTENIDPVCYVILILFALMIICELAALFEQLVLMTMKMQEENDTVSETAVPSILKTNETGGNLDISIEVNLSITIKDHNTIVINFKLPVSHKIERVDWKFINGNTVKNIPSTSTEKYNYSDLSPSLIIKDSETSDSGTYEIIVNNMYSSKINVVIPKEIYTEPMNVVPYYQETKQLREIESALRLNDEKLVILKGLPGSGKTQTANKFCERYRMMYSIVAKLSLRDESSLKQSLLELLEDKLKWQCTSNNREISFASVVENFQNYLNHEDRNNLPFVLVVDNIGQSEDVSDITRFVSLIKKVSRLNIILALTSGEYLADLRPFSHSLVEFNGMDMDEYMGLFNHLMPGENDGDFKNLVDVIGSTPIILATALKYMDNTNETSASYLKKYSSKAIPMMKAISPYFDVFHGANDPALKSQLFPLEHIKSISSEKDSPGNYLWKVMSLIPFLEYDAVSPVVLQACYRHLSNNTSDEKKTKIELLVKELLQFSLCQTFKVSRRRVRKKVCEGVMYSFHKVTMNSIELMEEEKSPNERNLKLDFLLKLFCSEIDIDAGLDITVARNLLFVPHAKKFLLNSSSESHWTPSREQNFLISYLYCAIGSTFLYERTNVINAHVSLMKARHFALTVIDQKPLATKDKCKRKDFPGHVNDDVAEDVIESTSQDILQCKLNVDFTRDFVLRKRRNNDEVTYIRNAVKERTIVKKGFKMINICEYHYLTMEEYNKLENLNIALSIEDLSKILLAELVSIILLNNVKALHIISCARCFGMDEEDEQRGQRLITGIDTEVERSQGFCDKLKKELCKSLKLDNEVQLFVGLQSDSVCPFLMFKYSRKLSDTPIDIKIAYFEELLKNKNTKSFDFGVIKLAKTRFTSYCQGNIIEYFIDKIEQEQNAQRKSAFYAEGRKKVNTLMSQAQKMEEGDIDYTWLLPTWLYIKCGNFLSQAEDCADIQKAIACFDNALEIETSRKAFCTLYVFEAYKGKIRCLRKLHQNSEVERVTKELTEMIRGQNRDEYLSHIQQILRS